MPTAIEFNNISKEYRLGLVSTRTLSHDMNRWWKTKILRKEDPYLKIGEVNDRAHKGESEYVWALKDINLKVEQGEVLGIIGKNGAGKSTLLKILSRVTSPTTGTIRARGRIASLLEVGTGFHPEMTGRENIYMNGAILGMIKKEIDRKLDEIVDFSGVERYIDTPVKRYSSGMTVRLGFAIAAHLEPEILVVDEVLAVGDAEFQKKAIGKMQDVSRGDGRTVLFVSHNMESILKLCKKGILLSDGKIDDYNNINEVVNKYQNSFFNKKSKWENSEIKENDIEILSFYLEKNGHILCDNVKEGDNLEVIIDFAIKNIYKDLTIGISLFDSHGRNIYRTLHTDIDEKINNFQKLGKNTLRAKLNTDILLSGTYNVVLDASRHNSTWIVNPYEEKEIVLTFYKDQSQNLSTLHSSQSIVNPITEWKLNF